MSGQPYSFRFIFYISGRIRSGFLISCTLQHIRKDEPISTKSIEKLCEALNCQPGDIMEYIEDETE